MSEHPDDDLQKDRLAYERAIANQRLKVVSLSTVGIALEWYDFFLYGTLAAIVFPHYFFPRDVAPELATLVSLVSFWIGIASRVFGALVVGYIGDRLGRKVGMFVDLIIMGLASLGIALTPGYEVIGYWGIVIVTIMRFFQGIAMGGEWGVASAFIVEHFHRSRFRAFWGSWVQVGVPIGLLMGSGLSALLMGLQGVEAFIGGGWKLLYYIGASVCLVGGVIRYLLLESPLFQDILRRREVSRNPIVDTLKDRDLARLVVLLAISKLGQPVLFFTYSVYALTYLPGLGYPRELAVLAVAFGAALELVFEPLSGLFADIWGRRRILLIGNVLTALYSIPFPLLLIQLRPDPAAAFLALGLCGVLHALSYSPQTAYYSELFPTKVRSTAIGFAYQVAPVFSGGIAPILMTILVGSKYVEMWWAVSAVLGIYSIASVSALIMLRETKGEDLPR